MDIEDNVGTRLESVVKRRGRTDRVSREAGWPCCWRARDPLRLGETKEATGFSLRGECCDRKRNSSMMAVVIAKGGRKPIVHA
jgi:hypothetical protein